MSSRRAVAPALQGICGAGRLIGVGIVALDDRRELVTPRSLGMALLHFAGGATSS
jgi:hypothetical protein